MNASHLLAGLLGGALVAAGFWLGSDASEPTTVPEVQGALPPDLPPSLSPALRPAAPPLAILGEGELAAAQRRVAQLEHRVQALEGEVAGFSEKLTPLLELAEQAKALGLGAPGTLIAPGLPPPGDEWWDATGLNGPPGAASAGRMAKLLGLDGARKKELLSTVDAILVDLKALEKEHAKVIVDGDTTTITIPEYAGGDELTRRWEDWATANLTHEEREKLTKAHAANLLFGSRLGLLPRIVKIKETGGMIEVSESAGSEGEERTQVQGPALAREFVLESYLHLLK